MQYFSLPLNALNVLLTMLPTLTTLDVMTALIALTKLTAPTVLTALTILLSLIVLSVVTMLIALMALIVLNEHINSCTTRFGRVPLSQRPRSPIIEKSPPGSYKCAHTGPRNAEPVLSNSHHFESDWQGAIGSSSKCVPRQGHKATPIAGPQVTYLKSCPRALSVCG